MLYWNENKYIGVTGGQTRGRGGQIQFAIPKLHANLSSDLYKPALIEDGYGFADGKIKGSTINDEANSASYYTEHCTAYAILTASGLGFDPNASGVISTNFCLTEDVTINASRFWDEAYIFSGILDGCGHTLTINCSQNGSWSSAHAFGALMGKLTGTIKNIKIVTNFYWEDSNSNGANQFVGGIAGRIEGGTLENVYIQVGISGSGDVSMKYTGRPQSNAVKMVGGCFGEAGDSQNNNPTNICSFTNVTIQIDGIGWENTAGGNVFGYPDVKFGVAGCIAHIAQNTTVNMKNISLKGSSNLHSRTVNCNNGGKSKSHKGAIIAYSEGIFNLENCKYNYRGTVTNNETLDTYYECSVMGACSNSNNISIANFYYTTGSYAQVNGYLEWQDSRTQLFGQLYSTSIDDYLGFYGDYLWIGDISQLSQRTLSTYTDIDGKYMDSIVFSNETKIVFPQLSEICLKKYAIIKIEASELQSSSNEIQNIVYGYFAYLSNIEGTTNGSFRLYYNNGNYIDYQFSGSIPHRIGIYNVYERYVNNNQPYHITKNTNIGYYN